MSLSHFFSWAGEVVVIFDWARDVMGCVRCSVSYTEMLVSFSMVCNGGARVLRIHSGNQRRRGLRLCFDADKLVLVTG